MSKALKALRNFGARIWGCIRNKWHQIVGPSLTVASAAGTIVILILFSQLFQPFHWNAFHKNDKTILFSVEHNPNRQMTLGQVRCIVILLFKITSIPSSVRPFSNARATFCRSLGIFIYSLSLSLSLFPSNEKSVSECSQLVRVFHQASSPTLLSPHMFLSSSGQSLGRPTLT